MEPRSPFSQSVSPTQSLHFTQVLSSTASTTVHEAVLGTSAQRFAVKRIEKVGLTSAQLAARRNSEIEVPGRYHCQCLLRPFGHFEDEKSLYVVLELCEGGDLRRHLEAKKILSEEEVCAIARDIAVGLSTLHDGLTVHRNLSLSSVLLTATGRAKIGGFKHAVSLRHSSDSRRTPCGSSDFSCVEMLTQTPYSFQADVWSLGCIIYACLCGSSPFQGFPPTASELSTLQISPRLPAFLSSDVRDLLAHLLEPDPMLRFTIRQALAHPFFNAPRTATCSPTCASLGDHCRSISAKHSRQRSRSADSLSFGDKFIFEYKETFSPAKEEDSPLAKVRRRQTETAALSRNLQERFSVHEPLPKARPPLSTFGLPRLRYDLAKSSVWLSHDGSITYQSAKSLFTVSADGQQCWYGRSKKREYRLSALPERLGKFYDYLFSFLEVVRSKTPEFIYENKVGTFTLMANAPNNNFEVYLASGERVKYRVGGKEMQIRQSDGSTVQVQPWQDWKGLTAGQQQLVQVCLQGLKTVREMSGAT